MSRTGFFVPLCHLLALLMLTAPAAQLLAQEVAPPPQDLRASIDESRELIKSGDYDRAIEILKGAIEKARPSVELLREAYLLLIKTFVFLGNDFYFKPQGHVASELNYKEARRLIAECLAVKDLRHLRPEPESEYPPEMIQMFSEVRSQLFGSFRVVELEPPDATVIMDADTLRTMPGDSLLGDVDIPVGSHLVVIQHERFKTMTDQITVSPNSILERPYRLQKWRGRTWYVSRVGAGLAIVGGAIAAFGGGSKGGQATQQPLPEAPPPPSNPRP